MKTPVFLATLICEALLGVSLLVTLVVPNIRIWPPPGRDSWQYRATWTLTIISVLGVLVSGVLDWNSFIFDHWSHYFIGGALFLSGLGLALWAVRRLSVHASLGLGGELVNDGPYRFSRNPQYLGDILALAGYGILSNSWMGLVTAGFGTVWFALAPFAEEPWLVEQYGERYAMYKREVPRFLSLRALFGYRKGTSAEREKRG